MKIEFEMIVFTNIEYWQEDWEVNANAVRYISFMAFLHSCLYLNILS